MSEVLNVYDSITVNFLDLVMIFFFCLGCWDETLMCYITKTETLNEHCTHASLKVVRQTMCSTYFSSPSCENRHLTESTKCPMCRCENENLIPAPIYHTTILVWSTPIDSASTPTYCLLSLCPRACWAKQGPPFRLCSNCFLLSLSSQDRIHVEEGVLSVGVLTLADAGMYQCVAENKHGVIYFAAELMVLGRMAFICALNLPIRILKVILLSLWKVVWISG